MSQSRSADPSPGGDESVVSDDLVATPLPYPRLREAAGAFPAAAPKRRKVLTPFRKGVIAVVLLLQLAAALFLLLRARADALDDVADRNRERFDSSASKLTQQVQDVLERIQQQLGQWRLIIPSVESAVRFNELFDRPPALVRLVWIPRVQHADRPAFERFAHSELSEFLNTTQIPTNITAVSLNATEGPFMASPVHPEYYVGLYTAPPLSTPQVYMWNMLSEPVINATIHNIIAANGEPVGSPRIVTPRSNGRVSITSAFGVTVPSRHNSSEVLGVLASVISWRDHLRRFIVGQPEGNVVLRLFDVTGDTPDATGCEQPMLFGGAQSKDGTWSKMPMEEMLVCHDPATFATSDAVVVRIMHGSRKLDLVITKGADFDEEVHHAAFLIGSAFLVVAIAMMLFVLLNMWMFKRHMRSIDEETTRYVDELVHAEQDAREAKEYRDQFLAFLSHELRNPLFGIQGTIDEGEEQVRQCEDPAAREELTYVFTALSSCTEQIERTLNTVVNVQNMTTGKIVLTKSTFHLSSLMDRLRSTVSPSAANKHVRLLFSLDRRLPQAVIGDRERLEEVLRHLLDNAIRHTPSGTQVTCRATVKEHDNIIVPVGSTSAHDEVSVRDSWSAADLSNSTSRAGIIVQFVVTDEGKGMTARQIKRALQPYTRERIAKASRGRGASLGLPVAKLLCRQMGGYLHVRSALDAGCAFTAAVRVLGAATSKDHDDDEEVPTHPLHLPVIDSEDERVDSIGHRSSLLSLVRPPIACSDLDVEAFAGRFLVVDDQSINRRVVARLLSKLCPRSVIETANDGVEAVESVLHAEAEGAALSCIFMDIQMPRMSGLDATKRLRSMGVTLPIIAVTGGTLEEEIAKYLSAGMNDVIHKPCKLNDFKTVIKAHWRLISGDSTEHP